MKRYLIYGDSETGKSTCCRKLLGILHILGPDSEQYEYIDWWDFKTVITISSVKIAIYSAGDDKWHLSAALDYAIQNQCDVLVATVRKGIQYKSALNGLVEGTDYEWLVVSPFSNTKMQKEEENRIVKDLITKILP